MPSDDDIDRLFAAMTSAATSADDDVICCNCERDCSRHFWMCDQDAESSWCPECWENTACAAGVHGESCPTEVFSTPPAGRGDA